MRPITLLHGRRTATRDKRPVPEVRFASDDAVFAARRKEREQREILEHEAKRELERIVAKESKEREAAELARRMEQEKLNAEAARVGIHEPSRPPIARDDEERAHRSLVE